MSEFSVLLKNYMDMRETTPYFLSQEIGIEWTLLRKFPTGSRMPTDPNMIHLLSAALTLSPDQSRALYRAYLVSRVGSEVYCRRQAVQKLLCTTYPSLPLGAEHPQHSPLPHVCEEVYSVRNLLKEALALEFFLPAGFISLISQPDTAEGDFVLKRLQAACITDSDLSITHLLCFDNTNHDVCRNLACLTHMIPTLRSCHYYKPYYYYGDIDTLFGPMVLFPFLLITSQYAIQLAPDFSRAICYPVTDGAYTLLHDRFDALLNLCEPLTHPLGDVFSCIAHTAPFSQLQACEGGEELFVLTPEFCYTPFFTPAFCDRYLIQQIGQREEYLNQLNYHCKSMLEFMRAHPIHYFVSEPGIRTFLATGRLTDFTADLFRPFLMRDRRWLLEQFLISLDVSNGTSLHLYDPAQISFPQNLVLTTGTHMQQVSMSYNSPTHGLVSSKIEEPTLVRSFVDYFSGLTEDLQVSRDSESRQRLWSILRESKRRGATRQGE